MYFNSIPKIYYDSQNNKRPKVVTNLLRRVGVRAKIKTNTALFDTYRVKAGETPEIIAHKLYGDSELHWIVMLMNNVTDRYHDWPMNFSQFNAYLQEKYVDSDGNSTASEVHHYEIAQSSGDTTIKIQVPQGTSGATTVTNYEYETALNEEKRKIDLLRNDYLGFFTEEFASLI